MSNRYKGGIISATPPTTTGGNDGVASGSWTLEQQMQAQAAGLWPNQPVFYIEDVFSTWLYSGTGATQTITNGINLSGKGGLVWIKQRNGTFDHSVFDTVRGATNKLITNSTFPSGVASTSLTAFTSSGFTLGSDNDVNTTPPSNSFVSWTFREQPKFFDVVTYTGNGSSQNIAHNLGSVPGCIIVKDTSNTRAWSVYHTSLGNTQNLILSGTNAAATATDWDNTTPTSTVFTVGNNVRTNASGATYVAYLFAHNAGGFGLTGTDNVISCGSFTTDGSGNATIDLGYEPQWVLTKNTATGSWVINDVMRGMPSTPTSGEPPTSQVIYPNLSNAEASSIYFSTQPTPTGFKVENYANASFSGTPVTAIYIAIRRGPMRTPTSGTSVFAPVANTQSSGTVRTIGFPADLAISTGRTTNLQRMFNDRLRGFSQTNTSTGPRLFSNTTDAETTSFTGVGAVTNTGYQDGDYFDPGISMIRYLFGRAPGFFDEVCYTGAGAGTVVNHNLTVVPELIISKARSTAASQGWGAFHSFTGSGNVYNYLQSSGAGFFASYGGGGRAFASQPTATQFVTDGQNAIDSSGVTYVAYLFASCPGVSKVGSYTGTGAIQTINCGFTGGARFVMIKRTDSTGDWYVWDTARGMIPANDPYLLLNSTAAEVTGTDFVDTTSVGFEITSTAPAAINANGGTFIFLAIA